MRSRIPVRGRLARLCLALAASVAAPAAAHAQYNQPPTVSIDPYSGDFTSATVNVTIHWSDDYGLDPLFRQIYFNNQDVTYNFTYSGWSGSTSATSTGTVTLQPGVNTFSAQICDSDFMCGDQAVTWQLVDASYWGVQVGPDGGSRTVTASANQTAVFTVTNTGQGTASFALTPSCTGVTSCALSQSSITLPAGGTGQVSMTYRSGAAGSGGTLQLTAASDRVSDAGSQSVSAAAATAAGYVNEAGDNTLLERDMCVTIAAAPASAYECGDLRLVHALPATRALGKSRVPTLLYTNQHARPYPIVAANVDPPAGATPDSLVGVIWMNGVNRGSRKWTGWAPGTVKRVAVGFDATSMATGVYDYTLAVTAYYPGGGANTFWQRAGQLAIVNRSGSPLGNGWWLAGLEQLVPLADGSRLWVGGDGSTRVYRPTGTAGVWTGPAFDRPDTLVQRGSEFVRTLPGRVEVVFDGAGRHVRTLNRMGHTTYFEYDAQGRPWRVNMPRTAQFSTGGYYEFRYAGSTSRVGSIATQGADPGTERVVTVTTDAAGRITHFTDPDASTVVLQYSGTDTRPSARTDRRGTRFTFGYNATTGRLASSNVSVPNVGSTYIQRSFRAAEDQGWQSPVLPADVYTRLNGPRQDVTTLTYFYLDRFGAPVRIRDAAGNSTTIERGDPRWPAAITRMVGPNGREVTAAYDARGNLESSTDWASQQNGRYATTLHRWDPVWDAVVQTTGPEGETALTGYDAATGQRAWSQAGTDPARRVTFQYNPSTSANAPGLVSSVTYPGNLVERYEYDARGNVSATVTPKGFRTQILNDALGRVIRTRTPTDSLQAQFRTDTVGYDVMDRVRRTDSYALNGSTVQHVVVDTDYDREGNTLSVSRRSEPDAAGTGTITTRWEYDAIGRAVAEIAPDGQRDSTFYDQGGNVVRTKTRRGHVITMQYDVMNRLVKRRVPEARYAARDQGIAARETMTYDEARNGPYPLYPNDGGTGFLVAADSAVYQYDALGNMTRADNGSALVRRAYNPNGTLASETQKILPVTGTDTTLHVYTVGYTYDLSGRRKELQHPSHLAPQSAYGYAQDKIYYGYDPQTGALTYVSDPLGNSYRFHQDLLGQVDTVYLPGQITERYGYDADGRLVSHMTTNASTGQYRFTSSILRNSSFWYDARGKLLRSGDAYGARDTLTASYSGLGHVTASNAVSRGQDVYGQPARFSATETFSNDAFANVFSSSTSTRLDFNNGQSTSYAGGSQGFVAGTGRLAYSQNVNQKDTTYYDEAGNIVFTTQVWAAPSGAWTDRASFYGADGTLRAVDYRNRPSPNSFSAPFYSTFEEYRYDALGRRVLVRTRRWCDGHSYPQECMMSTVRRTVWDGSAELYEIQMPGGDGVAASVMENDVGTVPEQFAASGNYMDPNSFFGRVAYTYGLGVDQPVAITRMGYSDKPYGQALHRWEDFVIVPHWTSRGQPDKSTFADGGARKCKPINGSTRCVYLDWAMGWFAYMRPQFRPGFWHGTLANDKQDQSGNLFRRNRYYDPASGRFTQEDPIGLAGGLNLYGFAGGDPVSYSDPYGLFAERDCPPNCRIVDWGGGGPEQSRGLGHVKKRHVNGKWGDQFVDMDDRALRHVLSQTVENGEMVADQVVNGERRFTFERRWGQIGTRGQRIARVVINESGQLVTALPVRNALRAGAGAAGSATGRTLLKLGARAAMYASVIGAFIDVALSPTPVADQ